MARRKSNKPYKGVLTTPSWKPDPTKSPEENWLDYMPVDEQKMNALFEHFGISQDRPGKWQLLAYALADTYVPGFAPSLKKVGKKATLDQAPSSVSQGRNSPPPKQNVAPARAAFAGRMVLASSTRCAK